MTSDTRGAAPSSTAMAHPHQPTQKLRDAWARVLENSAAVDTDEDSVAGALRTRMTSFEYLVRRCVLFAPPVTPSADVV